MREVKLLPGATRASWFEKGMGWLTLALTFYVMPYFMTGCLAILALMYLYIWVTANFATAFWLVVLVYAILFGGSYGFWYLKNNHQLSWFQKLPILYSLVCKLDWAFIWLRRFHALLYWEAKRVIPILVEKKKQLVIAAAKGFWALPTAQKVTISVVTILVVVPSLFYVSVTTVKTVRSAWPYGINRAEMSPEDMAMRKENRINHALWAVWGKPNAIQNAKCMDRHRDLIRSEAIKNGLTPERLEAQLFVESGCKADQVNTKSGAAGFAQIMLDVGCEEGLVMDKKFCSQVLKPGSKIKRIPENLKIEDRRLDPNYAIPAAAKILGRATRYWGDENWAFVQYHMGVGNQRTLVMNFLDETRPTWRKAFPANFSNVSDPDRSIPKAIAQFGISYDDIFFRCNPKTTLTTYRKLYRMSDESATYVYTGLAALKGFNLMRTDYSAFEQMVAQQQDPDGGLSNRPMRAWYSDKDAKYEGFKDVEKAVASGELLPVPNSDSNGFILRTTGPDRIGECDPGNESKYYFTKKATIGMMLFIGAKTQELAEGSWEATGLVRTHWMYDGKKCLPDTQPRTHVAGVAFDIGTNVNGKPMSSEMKRALIFVIRDLRADGLIDRIAEGKADHIVYNPEFREFFEEIYDDYMKGGYPLVVSQ